MHKENSFQIDIGKLIKDIQALALEVGFICPTVVIYRKEGRVCVEVLDDGDVELKETGELYTSLLNIYDQLKIMILLMEEMI